MSKSGFVETECGIASYSVDRPEASDCWDDEFGAPRGKKEVDEEGGVGTSVDDALIEFCDDIDGQKVIESSDESQTHPLDTGGTQNIECLIEDHPG